MAVTATTAGVEAAVVQAVKASGVIVRVTPEEFRKVLYLVENPLVVTASTSFLGPKMSDSHRRSAPISWALDTCADAPHTSGYASARRKHQSLKILAHLIRQNRSS